MITLFPLANFAIHQSQRFGMLNIRKVSFWVGLFFILPFFLYGAGDYFLKTTPEFRFLGQVLVSLNSLTVIGIGWLFFKLYQNKNNRICWSYLSGRVAEGLLLAAGLLFTGNPEPSGSLPDTSRFFYFSAMLALSGSSLPLLVFLTRLKEIPKWLGFWGLAGYGVLGTSCLVELAGIQTGLWPAIPGGLFELAFGIFLMFRGLNSARASEHPVA